MVFQIYHYNVYAENFSSISVLIFLLGGCFFWGGGVWFVLVFWILPIFFCLTRNVSTWKQESVSD